MPPRPVFWVTGTVTEGMSWNRSQFEKSQQLGPTWGVRREGEDDRIRFERSRTDWLGCCSHRNRIVVLSAPFFLLDISVGFPLGGIKPLFPKWGAVPGVRGDGPRCFWALWSPSAFWCS
ncbi:hypothetical protein TNIN_342281 [Trichonephila inaurata madagascariensis]|uniref:Uncharacterized protein n=1 Tax=Trichonephila inaurata madagascariensis TaxID=2747483 RepID=A0A8X7CI54_9ARAC|nr:hypothetical protein TNIN_342281 [Trichonephila inaurata madagascariensis]